MNSKKTAKQNRRIKNVKLQISNPGPELIWPGKNSETVCQVLDDSNRSLWRVTERFFPAQNFSSSVSLSPEFNIDETSVSPWLNKLFWGENFLVLQTLADRFAGKIDLIYIDPPFATGSSFSFQRPINILLGGYKCGQTGNCPATKIIWAIRLNYLTKNVSAPASIFLRGKVLG